MTAPWRTTHVTMTGSAVAYTVPDTVGSLLFRNVDGPMTVYFDTEDSATPYSFDQNQELSFTGMNIPRTIYFVGTNTHKVHIMYVVGGVD